jgi:hypothetical protein
MINIFAGNLIGQKIGEKRGKVKEYSPLKTG